MKGLSRVIEVDRVAYPVNFQGFDIPMEARMPDGKTIRFLPLTYREHMDALRLSLQPGTNGLELDTHAFCSYVLRRSGLHEYDISNVGGLALWWASGGGEIRPAATLSTDGWLDLGPTRAHLAPWSNGERLHALADSLVSDKVGESFDVVNYLDSMVRASVKSLDPVMALDDLDAMATATLLDAVVSLNVPDHSLPEAAFDGNPEAVREHARTTLRLCAALGWTPSKVWATPAAEVDRLLALIDRAKPRSSMQSPCQPGLADYPDAVVIQFEED